MIEIIEQFRDFEPAEAGYNRRGRWRVLYRIGGTNHLAEFYTKEAADLFAAAPRVLAERDRLREVCEAIAGGYVPKSEPFESAIAAGDATAFRAAFVSWAQGSARDILKETETNHAT